MKNKGIIIIIAMLIMTVFVLSGCGEDQNPNSGVSYVGGVDALKFEFIQGQPPEEIFDGDSMDFVVSIMLENHGEHSLFDEDNEHSIGFDFGRLTLRGINPEYYNINSEDLTLDFEENELILIGYKKNPSDGQTLKGGINSISFEPLRYALDLQGNNELPLLVDLCYNYRTRTSTNICVVSDIINNNYDVCDPYSEKITQNSGGPVHVNKIVQAPSGRNKLSLMIEVGAVNTEGTIFATVDSNNPGETVCDDSPTNQDKNKIDIRVYLAQEAATNNIECNGPGFRGGHEGTMTLYDGQPKTFVCTLDITDVEQDYIDQLYVDLEYAYGQQISKTLVIKDYE